jgi:hypothetical protein
MFTLTETLNPEAPGCEYVSVFTYATYSQAYSSAQKSAVRWLGTGGFRGRYEVEGPYDETFYAGHSVKVYRVDAYNKSVLNVSYEITEVEEVKL